MIKGQDILVLLALMSPQAALETIRELDLPLGLGVGPVHRSLGRLIEAGLIDDDRQVRAAQVNDFLPHSARYLFPPKFGGEVRGIPTAWAAAPLNEEISGVGLPPVWPHSNGKVRGLALEPVHKAAPDAAERDPELYGRLAIFDALRLGDARERGIAGKALQRVISETA
jgi:hypothetical protein